MSRINGVVAEAPLQHWDIIGEEWCVIIERYSRVLGGEEQIFDYSERSNVGALAAAAWRSGHIAIEEFRYNKQGDGDDLVYGRCDLWVSSNDCEFQDYVEAKQGYVSLANQDPASVIKPVMEEAAADATRTAANREEVHNVGVSFIAIYDRAHRIEGSAERIEAFIDLIKQQKSDLGYDAIAWTFPEEARTYARDESWTHARIGVLMLAQSINGH